MRVALRMIVGMSLCAAALITSSWLLKGNPAGEWVDAGLYLATGCFFASQVILAFPQIFITRREDNPLSDAAIAAREVGARAQGRWFTEAVLRKMLEASAASYHLLVLCY